jgi:hypothetical protein
MTPDCTLAAVDPKTLREIMGQGATRPETPRDREERGRIEADLESSPVRGTPLRRRVRNFRPDAESAVRALGGPTVWMRRLRAIEDGVDQHERQLLQPRLEEGEEAGRRRVGPVCVIHHDAQPAPPAIARGLSRPSAGRGEIGGEPVEAVEDRE